MTRAWKIGVLAAVCCAAPALAVGMTPLHKEGLTGSSKKAFYLTVMNPYKSTREYRAYVSGEPADAVGITILPERMVIKSGGQRRVMVIINDLEPGQSRETHVCAELAKNEGMINARVCSTLLARRVARRS